MKTGRFGFVAAGMALALTGAVGVAGAAEDSAAPATVYLAEMNGPCFSNTAGKPACDAGETASVNINTGEAVTWDFTGSTAAHNAAATNDVPADPTWKDYSGDFVNTGSYSRQFNQPGTYTFHCDAHHGMTGTITVTGTPVETQTPTPSPSATATPTPSTQPSDPGTTTPNPGGQTDAVKPTVSAVKLKALKRGAQVKFTLSEDATVTIDVKRARKLVKRKSLQATAGTRTVKVSTPKLKKGSYTIEVRARDAFGNRSTLAKKSLRIRR